LEGEAEYRTGRTTVDLGLDPVWGISPSAPQPKLLSY
jgi:hypothetical protein